MVDTVPVASHGCCRVIRVPGGSRLRQSRVLHYSYCHLGVDGYYDGEHV